MRRLWERHKDTFAYGFSLAAMMAVLRVSETHFVFLSDAFQWYAVVIALVFGGFGVWATRKLVKPKTVVIEKQIPDPGFVRDAEVVASYNISAREIDVLELMAEGCSNEEIAEKLFVSPNTVKTHASRIFGKLEVQRRTQAVERARRLRLIR